ncbi:MAG TPA: cytochrome c biogenesis protein CcdA [Dehalococcoidia bacterium]|nr:cytochrome c biogenesis protein CcdA [Dehalococcoidia bacterium]
MDGENVTLLIAFAAGVLSFASPCCLPLVPVYIGHMVQVSAETTGPSHRIVSLFHAAAFVAGFSVIFVAFWASIGLLGFFALDNARYMREIGGAILIFMGLHLLGVINIGILNREYVVGSNGVSNSRPGYPRSLIMGMTFAAGWTPCIGPVLGSIIGLAVIEDEVAKGTLMLVAYSAGLGVPFLVMALAVDPISNGLKKIRPVLAAVPIVSGALVVAIGVLILTNNLIRLNQFFYWGNV